MGTNTNKVPESPTHDEVNETLHAFHSRQTEMDWLIGEWLIAADELKVHVRFGAASFCEYAGRIFGWNWRQAFQRLDTAKRLRQLPQTADRLREGKIAWSAARELARVATVETEATWLERSEGKTIREIEGMVAGTPEGGLPDDEKNPDEKLHRVVLTFTKEEYERYRRAIAAGRADCDEFIEDSALVLHSLEEKSGERTGDGSRSRSQLLFMRTLDTGKTYIATEGGFDPVSAAAAEQLDCDSVQIAPPSEGVAGGRASQVIRPSVRRFCMARAGGRCEVPGCRALHFLDLHHLLLRMFGGTDDPENLVVLCFYHHRAFHEGWLIIEGSWALGLIFRHVTGKLYGSKDSPSALRHANGVLRYLLEEGYADHDAREILTAVWPLMEAGTLTASIIDGVASDTLYGDADVRLQRYAMPPDENGNTSISLTAHVGSDGDRLAAIDALFEMSGGKRPQLPPGPRTP